MFPGLISLGPVLLLGIVAAVQQPNNIPTNADRTVIATIALPLNTAVLGTRYIDALKIAEMTIVTVGMSTQTVFGDDLRAQSTPASATTSTFTLPAPTAATTPAGSGEVPPPNMTTFLFNTIGPVNATWTTLLSGSATNLAHQSSGSSTTEQPEDTLIGSKTDGAAVSVSNTINVLVAGAVVAIILL